MDHHDWLLWKLNHEHLSDLLRQAEQERLAREVNPANGQRGHAFYHVLDGLGRELVLLGEALQARHAAHHPQSLTHSPRGQS